MRCSEEFPLVKRSVEKHSDSGLTALYIGHQDRVEKLNRYAKEHGIPNYLFNPDDALSQSYGITYGAGFIFISRDGVVKGRIPKPASPAHIEAELKKIL